MVLTLKHVTQEVLFSYAPRGQYAGITKDPERHRRSTKKKDIMG